MRVRIFAVATVTTSSSCFFGGTSELVRMERPSGDQMKPPGAFDAGTRSRLPVPSARSTERPASSVHASCDPSGDQRAGAPRKVAREMTRMTAPRASRISILDGVDLADVGGGGDQTETRKRGLACTGVEPDAPAEAV